MPLRRPLLGNALYSLPPTMRVRCVLSVLKSGGGISVASRTSFRVVPSSSVTSGSNLMPLVSARRASASVEALSTDLALRPA